MDFIEYVRIKAPANVKERVQEMPVNMIKYAENLEIALHVGYLDDDYQSAFKKYWLGMGEYKLFEHIFGKGYMEKIQKMPVLTEEDKDALLNADVALELFIKKRIPAPRKKKPIVLRDTGDLGRWERKRIQVGEYGYRRILEELRKLDSYMQERRGIGYPAPPDQTSWSSVLKELIYAEFEYKFTAEDWFNLKNLIPESSTYEKVFGERADPVWYHSNNIRRWAQYRYDLETGAVAPIYNISRLMEARLNVEDMVASIRSKELTPGEEASLERILKGKWRDAITRTCRTCGEEARFKCEGCGDAVYCGEMCQRADWEIHENKCI